MPAARAKTTDRMARAFMDDGGGDFVRIGDMPPQPNAATPAALWLTTEGAQAIREMERKVICVKAGSGLATAISRARWRKEKDIAVAETDYFAYSFTAARDGWRLTGCEMLWTARVEPQAYLHMFGDFGHLPHRGMLPDFYLRDLTQEEIKESGLREGAVLSVSSAMMKKLGRFHMRKTKKREKKIRAILNEWRAPGGAALCKLNAKRAKNAWVISLSKKRG